MFNKVFLKLVHVIRQCGKHFWHQSKGDYIIHAMRRMALGRVQLNLKYRLREFAVYSAFYPRIITLSVLSVTLCVHLYIFAFIIFICA